MRVLNPVALLGLLACVGGLVYLHEGWKTLAVFGLGYAAAFFGECFFRVKSRPMRIES